VKPFFYLLFFLCLSVLTNAQSKSSLKNFEKAKAQLREGQVEKSISTLDKIVKNEPDFVQAWILKGDVYTKAGDYSKAIVSYRSALQTGKAPYVLFNLGEVYFFNQNYAEAEKVMQQYLQLGRTAERARDRAQLIVSSSAFAKEAIKQPHEFNPENLGSSINDDGHQYFPSISANNQTLIFTERKIEGNRLDEDFFQSIRDENGAWQPKERLRGRLNTPLNEGAQSLSSDGKTLFFAGCMRMDGFGSCDIYVSKKMAEGEWSQPQNLGENINTAAWESMPCISPDGKTLYFVRGKDSRSSQMTIMYSKLRNDGSWSKAQPIPGKINTPYRETTPFIYFDNNHLFFASDGHPGFGDLDFFVSKRQPDGSWGEPENLGHPINSPGEESSLIISPDGKTAYFASDRPEGYGGLDLYSFLLPASAEQTSVAFVEGKVVDALTKKPIDNALIEVISFQTGDTTWNNKSTESGDFFIVLPSKQNYVISIEKDGYMFYSGSFELIDETAEAPKRLAIELQPLEINAQVILKNIFFDYDSYELKAESFTELDRLYQLLANNPSIAIEITGHTDNQGSDAYNNRLSSQRAQAVRQYLLRKSIAPNRITAFGLGSTTPISSNDSEEGRAKNRRIEVRVIKK
jgi:outer membrane protein OmpA-like peptidoglycan-associated protein